MASQITFQESMFVRVKDEEEVFDCTGANHDRSFGDLAESNHDSNHSREQVIHGEKTTTGEVSVKLTIKKLFFKSYMMHLTLLKFLAKLFC